MLNRLHHSNAAPTDTSYKMIYNGPGIIQQIIQMLFESLPNK